MHAIPSGLGYFAILMSLFITSLNSGSNGNCYYVGDADDAILVDAGISCRETERRMSRVGLSMSRVRAVFVSHEHSDHIRGLEVLAKKHGLQVYITPRTMQYGRLRLHGVVADTFVPYMPVSIGRITVTAFPKFHDAADPHSFLVSREGVRVGVFTDIGAPCEHLTRHFSQCHAAFLESNYDERMLELGRYPWHLKQRIRGGQGHLSNRQALELFLKHRPPYMSHLLLSHLSKENNCPQLVNELFSRYAADVQVAVASRYEPSAVYEITGGEKPALLPPQHQPHKMAQPVQASLF